MLSENVENRIRSQSDIENALLAKSASPEKRREGAFTRQRTLVRQGRVQERDWDESENSQVRTALRGGLDKPPIYKGEVYPKKGGTIDGENADSCR